MPTKLPLNIKPTTLATWDPFNYLYAWRCASQRARLAKDPEVAASERQSANALYSLYEQRKEPAFSPKLPNGFIKYSDDPRFDRLLIDRSEHIAKSMNGKPISIPDYISEAICDDDHNWEDKLATWLEINDDANQTYTYSELTVGSGSCNDIQGQITLTYFYLDDGNDKYHKGFYGVVDGLVYDCTDSSIADCGILDDTIGWYLTDLNGEELPEECGILDDTIGWYLTDLNGEELPEECETYNLAVGYSNNPTNRLDEIRHIRSEPIWHWGLNCFVGRIESWPYPVRMYPELMLR